MLRCDVRCGSFFTIRDVVALYPALALRLFLLSTQYRQAVNYTQRALEEVRHQQRSVMPCWPALNIQINLAKKQLDRSGPSSYDCIGNSCGMQAATQSCHCCNLLALNRGPKLSD